jgi:hypothetical protein
MTPRKLTSVFNFEGPKILARHSTMFSMFAVMRKELHLRIASPISQKRLSCDCEGLSPVCDLRPTFRNPAGRRTTLQKRPFVAKVDWAMVGLQQMQFFVGQHCHF